MKVKYYVPQKSRATKDSKKKTSGGTEPGIKTSEIADFTHLKNIVSEIKELANKLFNESEPNWKKALDAIEGNLSEKVNTHSETIQIIQERQNSEEKRLNENSETKKE